MRPRVSVIIPCFNAERTVRRAVQSVRRQRMADVEIIVVDDGSADASLAAARACGDDVTVIALAANRGVSAARNAGIAAARGEFVAFLDADDEWLSGKLERQLAEMERGPALGLVATAAVSQWDHDAAPRPVFPREQRPATGPEAWRTLLQYAYVLTSSVLARTEVVRRVGGFDEGLVVAEDQDLWIRIGLVAEIGHVDEVLVLKHERPSGLSSMPLGGLRYMIPVVLRHVEGNRHRLTPAERRRILGTRLTMEGRNAYYNGLYRPGAAMLGRAIRMGHRPLANLFFLLRHAPPARWLKRALLGAPTP